MVERRSPSRREPGFERYLRESYAPLVAALQRGFSGRIAAEDAVQEALVRAWQMSLGGEEIRSLDGWMTTAATNIALSQRRALQAEGRALERIATDRSRDGWAALGQAAVPRLGGPIEEAVRGLPKRQREVVVLHYYGDLALREVAVLLGVSEGAVKSTLHDARRRLRRSVSSRQQRQPERRRTMKGWHLAGSQPGEYDYAPVDDHTYEGKPAVRLWCTAERPSGFGTLMQDFAARDFLERRVRFSGALRCRGVEDRVGLWMRVDGPGRHPLAFDNMDGRPIRGDSDWERYEVVLDVAPDAQAIALGVLLIGAGEAWMADFKVDSVSSDVATTGSEPLPTEPQNLDFSDT